MPGIQITKKADVAVTHVGHESYFPAWLDDTNVADYDPKRGICAWNSTDRRGSVDPQELAIQILVALSGGLSSKMGFVTRLTEAMDAQVNACSYVRDILVSRLWNNGAELTTFIAAAEYAMLVGAAEYIAGGDRASQDLVDLIAKCKGYISNIFINSPRARVFTPADLSAYILGVHVSKVTFGFFMKSIEYGSSLVAEFLKEMNFAGSQVSLSEGKVVKAWRAMTKRLESGLPIMFADIAMSETGIRELYDLVDPYAAKYRYVRPPSEDVVTLRFSLDNGNIKSVVNSTAIHKKVVSYIPFAALMKGYKLEGSRNLNPVTSSETISDLLFETFLPTEQNQTEYIKSQAEIVAAIEEAQTPNAWQYDESHIASLFSESITKLPSVINEMPVSSTDGVDTSLFRLDTAYSSDESMKLETMDLRRSKAILHDTYTGKILGISFDVTCLHAEIAIRWVAAQLFASFIPFKLPGHSVTIEIVDKFPNIVSLNALIVGNADQVINADRSVVARFFADVLRMDPSFILDYSQTTVLGRDLLSYYFQTFHSIGGRDIIEALGIVLSGGHAVSYVDNLAISWVTTGASLYKTKALVLSGPKRRDALVALQQLKELFSGGRSVEVQRLMAHALSIYLTTYHTTGGYDSLNIWLTNQ